MISKYIEEKKFCSRWVSDEEANKLKLINERVIIETWFGRILLIINYFVVRKLVHTTGESFFPSYNTEADKYIVILTWIVFAIIVFISIVQLVTKNKIYVSDSYLSKEKITYYKYRIFHRVFRVFILVLTYMTLYQILFQVTISGIDIKRTIIIWIIAVNLVVLIYLTFIVGKNVFKGIVLSSTLEDVLEDKNYSLSDLKKKLSEKRGEINGINSADLAITFSAIDDLINVAENTGIVEKKSFISKTELITNVSHDLKTPLTSVINYVNFLSRNDLTEIQRQNYIDILERKTNSLKSLIGDLKDSIGSNDETKNVELENLNILDVLECALFELKEKIDESSLEFNINIENKKIRNSNVDYKKMIRVFHNLISNILKYSEENSEVYIKLEQDESVDFLNGYYTRITFRNTSSNEINIKGEELIERFRRGDSSRKTEGSGLGLNIARSLMEIQGGELKVNAYRKEFVVDIII
ncbi:Signal transduction histidine-protein kinase BarA [uncultured Clostridium sp.]|uniref:sensor histidine kinase n=1 Tax=uncultured Clostridium sp. TaxID=59620 RepID=UPI00082102C0|nr:sensor histidine kinase [uncultured Clostridium sp.]SCJ60077.1 Signal transduction histidine-protein kinase BarA [uncultured Clostridium sp.]